MPSPTHAAVKYIATVIVNTRYAKYIFKTFLPEIIDLEIKDGVHRTKSGQGIEACCEQFVVYSNT